MHRTILCAVVVLACASTTGCFSATTEGGSTGSTSAVGGINGSSGASAASSGTGSSANGESSSSTSSSSSGSTGTTGSAAFRILSFEAASPVVDDGAQASLSWSIQGHADTLLLTEERSDLIVPVLGLTSYAISPVRRERVRLDGAGGGATDSRTIVVAARGLELIAGSGTPGWQDGTGAHASFDGPTFGALDSVGNLYVSDSGGQVIRRVDRGGHVTTIAGVGGQAGYRDGPAANALFNYPTGIAVDAAGNVYVAEVTNETIRRIDPAGNVTTLAGHAGLAGSADGTGDDARFDNPNALAVDSHGNLFLADSNNHTIRKITPQGAVTTFAGQAGGPGDHDGKGDQAHFQTPNGLAIDAQDDVYVIDSTTGELRKIDPQANVTTVTRNVGFNYPSCVAVAPDGQVYVADTNNYVVRRVDPDGGVETVAGNGYPSVQTGPLPGGLENIYGLVANADGDLYVLSGNRVLQITAP